MYWIWILTLIIFYSLYKTLKDRVRSIMEIQKLPGPPKHNIFLGNIAVLQTDSRDKIFNILRNWGKVYFPIYKSWFILESAANIFNPEELEVSIEIKLINHLIVYVFKIILSNPKHINKSKVYNLMKKWLGTGLLTSGGSKWQHRRKILTPAFHFSILQQFIAIFNHETDRLVDNLKDHMDKPFVQVSDHISQFTLKTIAETAMGTKLDFKSKKERQYKQAIFDVGEILLYKLMRPWLYYNIINISYFFYLKFYQELKLIEVLHKFTQDVIKERQKNFIESDLIFHENHDVYVSKKRLAMLDLLISAKNEGAIDDEGIREEVDTFMFEGHDTTAVALSFALMLIACHKEIQEKIVEEMKEVLGDLNKKPSYNDLQQLKYMERCIKEVLRLYPSVHYISRELGEDVTTHSGYLLPKSSIVHIHIYDLHHNPNIFPDPEKFDPDRFLPKNSQTRHTFAYLPFSAGPRNCIGQKFALLEMKAALCGILGNFILEPVDSPETIVVVVDIVLRTKDPIKVKFSKR